MMKPITDRTGGVSETPTDGSQQSWMASEIQRLTEELRREGIRLESARFLSESLEEEIEWEKRKVICTSLIAVWFSENSPGTPVPEWCHLFWSDGELQMDQEQMELIERVESEVKWVKRTDGKETSI